MSDELTEGIDYTIENGRWIFTAAFLLRRGYCCESGCRNCPYGFRRPSENPPPPPPKADKS